MVTPLFLSAEVHTACLSPYPLTNDILKPTLVQHNVKLKDKSGCEHQIDVYWEYEIAGNKHRVAIECKNYNSLVPIGKVRDFKGVLENTENTFALATEDFVAGILKDAISGETQYVSKI